MILDKILDVLHHSLFILKTSEVAHVIGQDVHVTKRMLSILRHQGKVDRLNVHGTLVWWITPASMKSIAGKPITLDVILRRVSKPSNDGVNLIPSNDTKRTREKIAKESGRSPSKVVRDEKLANISKNEGDKMDKND